MLTDLACDKAAYVFIFSDITHPCYFYQYQTTVFYILAVLKNICKICQPGQCFTSRYDAVVTFVAYVISGGTSFCRSMKSKKTLSC